MAQFAISNKDQSLLLVSQPVSQIRERVEQSFHTIGAVLNQLAGVMAPIHDDVTQSVFAETKLSENKAEFRETTSRPAAAIQANQTSCAHHVDKSLNPFCDPTPLDQASEGKPAALKGTADEINLMIRNMMSTLQRGDIANQRLNNIGRTVIIVEDAELSFDERAAFANMIADQIDHTLAELVWHCGIFAENIEQIAGGIDSLIKNADIQRFGFADSNNELQERLLHQLSELAKLTSADQPPPLNEQAHAPETIGEILRSETQRLKALESNPSERSARIWLSPSELQELVRTLRAEIPHLRHIADGAATAKTYLANFPQQKRDPREQSRPVEILSQQIFSLYTMNSEREVHKKHFWVEIDTSDCDPINLFVTPEAAEETDLRSVLF